VEIADVLTFIRANFGNESGSVTPEEVSRIRAKGKTN
jgi:mono/diheme cytochrome c family protein